METLVKEPRAPGALLGPDSEPAAVAAAEQAMPEFNAIDEVFTLISMLADLSELKSNLDTDEVKKMAAHIAARTNGIANWLSERHQVSNPFTLHGFLKDPIGSFVSEKVLETLPEDVLEMRDEHMAKTAAVFPDFRGYLAMLDRNSFQIREDDFVSWVTRPTS